MNQKTIPKENVDTKEIKGLHERFEKEFEVGASKGTLINHWDRLLKFIKQEIAQAENRTAKAFGGCTLCYGKGYATTKVQASTGSGDFEDVEPKTWDLNPYRICSCDRGKQFHSALEAAQGDERHRIGNALQILSFDYTDKPELPEKFKGVIYPNKK